MEIVIPLDEIEDDQLSLVGGKALNLARLRRAGFKVPHGFVLTTAAYLEAKQNDQGSTVPKRVWNCVRETYRRMAQPLVAVRSSATHEDSAAASFAGQGQTILNVNDEQSLLNAISTVWRSLEAAHVREYERRQHIDAGQIAIAVLVQELVPADVSGVIFTVNPVTGCRGEMVINATWGLGEPLVSGKISPDEVIIEVATRTAKRTTVGNKGLVLNALGHEPSGGRPADALCLNDELIKQLLDAAGRVAEHFDGPQDIEWSWHDQLYLLQTRPLTTVALSGSDRVDAGSGEEPANRGASNRQSVDELLIEELRRLESQKRVRSKIWAAKGMAEILPCPTPLSWEVASRFMSGEEGYGRGQQWLGFDPAPGTILEKFAGYIYVDLQRESGLFFQHAPIGLRVREIEENPLRAAMPRQVFDWRKLRPAFFSRWPQLIMQTVRCVRSLNRWKRTFLPFYRDEFLPGFEQYTVTERARNLAALSLPALAELFEQRLDHFLTKSSPILTAGSILAAMTHRELEDLLIDRLGAEGIELTQQLLTGLRPNPILDMHEAMLAVAQGNKSAEAFVDAFGHRCGNEFELASARWREDMAPLLAQVEQLRDASELADGASSAVSIQRAAEARLDHVCKRWGRVTGELVRSRVRTARKFFPLREWSKDLLMQEYELLRIPLVELDRRLDLAGGVFYLNTREIQQCAAGNALTDIVTCRRREHALVRKLQMPQVILGSELANIRCIDRQESHSLGTPRIDDDLSSELRGVGVSFGRAQGRVRLVRSCEERLSVQDGEILVVDSLDATWTSAYARCVGLVAEHGATLSHGAIVAREFGIPAVVNVAECTSRLQTGQMIEVDGSKGSVTRLS